MSSGKTNAALPTPNSLARILPVQKRSVSRIHISASHIQVRNFAEFLETVFNYTDRSDEVHVHLITGYTEAQYIDEQIDELNTLQTVFGQLGIVFTYEFDESGHEPVDCLRHRLENNPRPRLGYLPALRRQLA